MKRKMIAAALVVTSVLMTACSTPAETTTAASETTTAETTTEATTTTTVATTTEETKPSFTPEEHGGIVGDWATGFDFGSNAVFETGYDETNKVTYPCYPNYAPGETVTITFKSDKKLELGCIVKCDNKSTEGMDLSMIMIYGQNPDTKHEGITAIQKGCKFSSKDGTYTVTIPGEYIESGHFYLINIIENKSKKKNETRIENYNFGVRCYVK